MSTTVTPSQESTIDLHQTNGKKGKGGKRKDARSGKRRKGKQAASADPAEDWQRWAAHLKKRKTPVRLAAVFGGQRHTPLLWSMPGVEPSTCELLERLHISGVSGVDVAGLNAADDDLAETADMWLKDAGSADSPHALELSAALELLGWTYALPSLAARLEPDVWRRLLDFATSTAEDAVAIALTERPLLNQLLAGELALVLATLFPELKRCCGLAGQAREALNVGVKELLDEGLPEARNLHLHRPLLGCWTRCESLAQANDVECLKKSARRRVADSLRQMCRLARHDGGQMLLSGASAPPPKLLVKIALDRFGGGDDRTVAALSLGLEKGIGKKTPAALPQPSDHSAWAEAAILRARWQRKSESLAVTYHQREVDLELAAGKRTICAGRFEAAITVDGQPLEPIDDWEEVCWTADDDVDYLEIEMKLSDGWKLQRQLVLVREDRLLLAADALIGQKRGRIEYRAALPLAADMRFAPAKETNEGFLESDKRLALVLPLALPEWRAECGPGRLFEENGRLTHAFQVEGQALYAPLLIDLKPSRVKQPFTWRRLTVAEDLALQPADVAVGYRIQIGGEQWLVYRTLADTAPRTLLGQHLFCDFYFGRFDTEGEVEDLVEVDNENDP